MFQVFSLNSLRPFRSRALESVRSRADAFGRAQLLPLPRSKQEWGPCSFAYAETTHTPKAVISLLPIDLARSGKGERWRVRRADSIPRFLENGPLRAAC